MRLKKTIAGLVAAVMAFTAVATPLGDNLPAVRDSVGITAEASTNGYTADDAIAWAKAQVGKVHGTGQCVCLIWEYYRALGQTPVSGNGCDYASDNQQLPPGWNRYKGATPQKGDILVWTGGYGHVAIYESENSTYHENWTSNQVQNVTYFQKQYTYEGNTVTYWGVIRPDFDSAKWYSNRTVENIGTDFYANIINSDSSMPIATNGTNVELADSTGDINEVWYFERQNDGSYKIKSCENNKILDVDGLGTSEGTNVQTYDSNECDAQRWYLYRSGNGYLLRSKCADTVLDIKGGGKTSGTNAQMWTVNESAAQIFLVWKLNKPSESTVSVTVGTSYTPTVFTWTATSDTIEYDVKIWKNKLWEGDAYHVQWNAKGYSYSIILPEGHYEAYVESRNNFCGVKSANNVAFDVVKGECPHSYDEWTVVTYPTCIAQGEEKQVCSICQKVNTRKISVLGHNYSSTATIDVQPTCLAEGSRSRTCSVCGTVESQTIAALGHTEVIDKAVEATCTKTGLTEGKHCSVCNAVIKAQKVVPAKGHTEVIDKAVAATCTKTGLTEGKHCSVCDAVIMAQETVPATGKHSFGDWKITKAATCTATGTKTRTCSVCGKVETATIAKIVHKYVNTEVKPTYTAQGYTLHKCSVCGTSYKDTYTAKLTLEKVTGAKLGGRAADALRVNWTRNVSADGYIVEMYKNGKWVRAAKITNKNTTTFRKAGLKASTVYKFRVRAYKMIGSVAAYSDYTATITARTNPSIMKGVKIAGKAKDALRVNWTKNTSAQGYIVEMYKGGKWVRVAKITNSNTTTFRKAGLAKNTAYKFRVRAYHMSGKTALYGNYGNVSGRTLVR